MKSVAIGEEPFLAVDTKIGFEKTSHSPRISTRSPELHSVESPLGEKIKVAQIDSDMYDSISDIKSQKTPTQTPKWFGQDENEKILWGKLIHMFSMFKNRLSSLLQDLSNEEQYYDTRRSPEKAEKEKLRMEKIMRDKDIYQEYNEFIDLHKIFYQLYSIYQRRHIIEMDYLDFIQMFSVNIACSLTNFSYPNKMENLTQSVYYATRNNIEILELAFPLLTKWSQVQIIKSDIYQYIGK